MAAKDITGLHQPVIEERPSIPEIVYEALLSNQDPQPISDWVPCQWIERQIIAMEQNSKGVKP